MIDWPRRSINQHSVSNDIEERRPRGTGSGDGTKKKCGIIIIAFVSNIILRLALPVLFKKINLASCPLCRLDK